MGNIFTNGYCYLRVLRGFNFPEPLVSEMNGFGPEIHFEKLTEIMSDYNYKCLLGKCNSKKKLDGKLVLLINDLERREDHHYVSFILEGNGNKMHVKRRFILYKIVPWDFEMNPITDLYLGS